MIAVFLKDLREMWAGPVTLIALAVVSCLVMALAAALPLPEPELRIGVAPAPAGCRAPTEHVDKPAEPAAPDAAVEDEQPILALHCPFPDRDVLVHAIKDLAGARYEPVDATPEDSPPTGDPEDRWVENEAWETMDRERLNVLFVWYPTFYAQDDAANSLNMDQLRSYGAEKGGVWIAYTQARSTAHAGQIRFSVRQVQGTSTHLANANLNGESFASPSIGFADSFTELGSVFVGLRHADGLDAAWTADDKAILSSVEEKIAGYESWSQIGPLPEEAAQFVRAAIARTITGLETRSVEELRQKFFTELGGAESFAPAPPPPADGAAPDLPPEAAPESVLQSHEVYYFSELSAPASYRKPGEDPLLVLTPFLLTERDGPPRSTSAWLIPGLILIIGSAIAFMLAAGSNVREREHGTEHLLKAGRTWWRAAIGKSLAPAAAAFVVVLMLMLTAQVFFGFQIKPAWPYAILCAAMAVLAASFQGVAVGSLLRNQSAALAISGAYLICLILFGNILIPMDGAVWPTSWLSQVLPTRLLSEEWADWMTWGVPLQLGLAVGLVLLMAASLGALLLGAFARQRSV